MIIDAGLFALIIGIAFITLIISFKIGALLKIVSMILFFAGSIMLLAGDQVAYSETATDGSSTWTTTKYIISDNGEWLGWILLILGIFSGLMFFMELVQG